MSANTEKCNGQEWLLASSEYACVKERTAERWQELLLSLGTKAVAHEVNYQETDSVEDDATLLGAIRQASQGDMSSRRMIKTNVATDIQERNFKVGLSQVELDISNGSLSQEGRKLTSIHQNTLAHTELIPEMHRRTTQELFNIMYLEDLIAEDVLQTHDAVFFSPTSTNMTQKEKQDYNFFLATESMSIQLFSLTGSKVRLETALVAGKPTPESERQDIKAIQMLAASNGIAIASNDGSEILSHMVLIPKDSLPGCVTDLVRQYDDINGTFFGQAAPRQDYEKYKRACLVRNAQFEDIVETITGQLIQEAEALTGPLDAILRLDELSERYSVRRAVENDEIDAEVFGLIAARHIEEARIYYARGEYELAQSSTLKAIDTAMSGSCPLKKDISGTNEADSANNPFSSGESTGKKWMNCPFCKAKVYADPCAKVLSCFECSAKVVNGHVVSSGDAKDSQSSYGQELSRQIADSLVEALRLPDRKKQGALSRQ